MKKFISLILVVILACGIVSCAFAEQWVFTIDDINELAEAGQLALDVGLTADGLVIATFQNLLQDGTTKQIGITTNEDTSLGYNDIVCSTSSDRKILGVLTDNFLYITSDEISYVDYLSWTTSMEMLGKEMGLRVKILDY